MFSKPEVGWTTVTIGEYEGSGSYLTDIPLDFLNAAIVALYQKSIPFVLHIDEEGVDSYIVSYYHTTIINRTTDTIETYSSFLDFRDLIREGLTDIEANFDDWLRFDASFEEEKELTEKARTFRRLIREVKALLPNNEVIGEDEHVYCTHCNHMKIDFTKEYPLVCEFENECDFLDPEESKAFSTRPHYEDYQRRRT